jgi:hypothetical protein
VILNLENLKMKAVRYILRVENADGVINEKIVIQ